LEDTSFAPRGNETHINYEDDFHTYCGLIERNMRKAPIKELFKTWDNSLFPRRSVVASNPTNVKDSSLLSVEAELDEMDDEDSKDDSSESE
jgi:hypothetical protein